MEIPSLSEQAENAGEVLIPAVSVEVGQRASSAITTRLSTMNAISSQGKMVRRLAAVGTPIALALLTYYVGGSVVKNKYIQQSAVGMAIPAVDNLIDPVLAPVEDAVSGKNAGSGSSGGGSGSQSGTSGLGYGESLVGGQSGMGEARQLPGRESAPQSGMGINRSTNLLEEEESGQGVEVAMDG